MINAYSSNVSVAANAAVPLNTVAIVKGNTATLTGASTINLNKCGVYMVEVNATAIAAAAGDITLELLVNGVAQPQTVTTVAASDTTSANALSFETLVQVQNNNGPCACNAPTTITVQNIGEGVTLSNVNVVVTKLC